MKDKTEYSESGNPIYHYKPRQSPFELAHVEDQRARQKLEEHITRYIGKIDRVFHEIISDLVHLDIYIVAPTPQKNYYTLITGGMSDRPMTVPEGFENERYAELMLSLPAGWPMEERDFQNMQNYWPLYWLKRLARFPHEYQSWLNWGHTIPNGEPARPFADNTELSCMLILEPVLVPDNFRELVIDPQKVIHFWSVVPLYAEETQLKLRFGSEYLLERFEKSGITEFLNPVRPNFGKIY